MGDFIKMTGVMCRLCMMNWLYAYELKDRSKGGDDRKKKTTVESS